MGKNILRHIKLVLKHKWLVFKFACKIGIPWRGFMHDWSKFSPTEFGESINYYMGTHSPVTEARRQNGYSKAWVHHVGKNKHHYQYWVDWNSNGPMPVVMPYKYVAEMICDKLSAGIVYSGRNYNDSEPIKYYEKERKTAVIHESVDKVLLEVFTQIENKGIKKTLKRKNLKSIYNKYCGNI